ncbi:MAG: ABC transporter permease [Phycisphaerae bacterium]|nr:ABC transporter permease [Phycisphaerae bacterium]
MSTLINDLQYAFRRLCKHPGFTAIALVTLAIGIGANTFMFSLVNMMIFRPAQVEDPERLVHCGFRGSEPHDGPFRYQMYTQICDDNQAFSDLIALSSGHGSSSWVQGSTIKPMDIMYTSANYFSALGVKPVYGRTFLPEEERYGSESVAVLSYRMWKELGGDPQLVGQIIDINTRPCRVVGVAPKGFHGTTIMGPDLWLPLGAYGAVNLPHKEGSRYPSLLLIGRLKPDLDMAAAEAQLQVLTPRVKASIPYYRDDPKVKIYLARLHRWFLGAENPDDTKGLRQSGMTMMGVSSVILLIACLNLANMLNVQGAQRQREIAIRMAIGGGRLRIIRQLLIESLLLALLGGAMAAIPALVGIRMFNAYTVRLNEPIELPSFDVRVFSATLGCCLIATVLFGLKPALNLSKRDVIGDLKDAGVGMIRATRRKWRFMPRGLSVIGQIALSVVFVMVATLFVRTALKVANSCPGFDLDGKIVVKVDALASGYTQAQAQAACNMLGERLKGTSGIEAVGWSRGFPVGDASPGLSQKIMEYQPGVEDDNAKSLLRRGPMVFSVHGDYFEAMGVRLMQGRPFRSLDSKAETEPPIIIDQGLARKLRRDGNALDCLIQHGWGSDLQVYRVVGVVPNQQDPSGASSEWAHIYQPISADQVPIYMHIQTSPEMESTLLQSLGSAIRKIDPQLEVVSLMSLADHHRRGHTVVGAKMNATATTIFGGLAMFLAGLGLYAVKGHLVATRTNEIGLRMALGAKRWDVLALVFRQNAVSTLAGLVLGILLAIGLTSLIRNSLQGISPMDPVSIITTVVVLAVTSLLAGYVPARRAVNIDPMEALRYE